MKPMRILLVGEWQAEIHEAAWQRGLSELGHEIVRLGWFDRFSASSPKGRLSRFSNRLQNKLLFGPRLRELNRELLDRALELKPDALILYRPTHVLAGTIDSLRTELPRSVVATFNNDDAFSPRAPALLWRHYKRLIQLADLNLAYRASNVADLKNAGARGVHLLRSYYLPWRDRPTPCSAYERARLGADILFAGHYEDDGRMEILEALAVSGVDFKVFGPDWSRAPRAPSLDRFRPIAPLAATDYVKAISASRIGLCLLSGLNRDTYTRRCFEIPAIGALLVCERTKDMQTLYEEGIEAEYFSTPRELVGKVRGLLADPARLAEMARAGRARAEASGYDVVSRMRELEQLLQDALLKKRGG